MFSFSGHLYNLNPSPFSPFPSPPFNCPFSPLQTFPSEPFLPSLVDFYKSFSYFPALVLFIFNTYYIPSPNNPVLLFMRSSTSKYNFMFSVIYSCPSTTSYLSMYLSIFLFIYLYQDPGIPHPHGLNTASSTNSRM